MINWRYTNVHKENSSLYTKELYIFKFAFFLIFMVLLWVLSVPCALPLVFLPVGQEQQQDQPNKMPTALMTYKRSYDCMIKTSEQIWTNLTENFTLVPVHFSLLR